MQNKLIDGMIAKAVELGAFKAAIVPVTDLVTDVYFRQLCKNNLCGRYGRCWTCPPDAGDIDELIKSLNDYKRVMVYQTVSELEDSFDIEGMTEAAVRHNGLIQEMKALYNEDTLGVKVMHLGAGGCQVCEKCAKIDDQPCRYPDKAVRSLETYGINVSKLAESGGMKYINGQDTVTYFGAVFFDC